MGRSIFEPLASIGDCPDVSPLADFRINRIGDQSIMYVSTEDGQQIAAHIRFVDEAAWVNHEASVNAAAMVTQLRLSPDYGAGQVARMMRRGMRPDVDHTHVKYYPSTGEYGYILQFPNRGPVPILLKQSDIDAFRVKEWIARSAARGAH